MWKEILPGYPQGKGSISLSPIACVEVKVRPTLGYRFIPDRFIGKNSYFAFLSTTNLRVRAQMQLNQDSLDNQNI